MRFSCGPSTVACTAEIAMMANTLMHRLTRTCGIFSSSTVCR